MYVEVYCWPATVRKAAARRRSTQSRGARRKHATTEDAEDAEVVDAFTSPLRGAASTLAFLCVLGDSALTVVELTAREHSD